MAVSIGIGFVSICLSEKDCSPAGDVTVKTAMTLPDDEARIGRIRRVAERNLTNTLRVLAFMRSKGLSVYRFATHLIPLATHPVTDGWQWWSDPVLLPLLERIGAVIRERKFRVSTHPPQLCVLNSPDPEVFQWVQKYTAYHVRLFESMGLDEGTKIVLHVGRRIKDEKATAERGLEPGLQGASDNVARLPEEVRSRLVIENDDRTYSARQTLTLCQRIGVPMVFDLHHHTCRNDGEDWADLLPDIFATWTDRPPKVHLSSPRSTANPRAHADYVDPAMVGPFLEKAATLGDFDIMVEAKQKDLAALRLRDHFPRLLAPT